MSAPAFDLVSGMERPVDEARVFALALALAAFAETIDTDDGSIVQLLAWSIMDRCKRIEESRGELFQLTHPNRDHFEKVGWPSSETPPAK